MSGETVAVAVAGSGGLTEADLLKSKYFRASDLETGPITLAIRTARKEMIGQGARAEEKGVLYFQNEERALVLNTSRVKFCFSKLGKTSGEWTGKQVTLTAIDTQYAGQPTRGIVLSLPARPQASAAPDVAGNAELAALRAKLAALEAQSKPSVPTPAPSPSPDDLT